MMTAYYPDATKIADAQAITVIEGSESTSVDIRWPERTAHTISGTVTFGPDNEPAAFAEILIERKDELGYSAASGTARSETDGKWELRGVPAGEYSIRFGGSVHVGQPESHVFTIAPKRISVRVEHDDVVVAETKLSQGSTITGTVTMDGKPAARSYVMVVNAIPEKEVSAARSSKDGTSRNSVRGYLKDNGAFWLGGLPRGRYVISLSGINEEYYVKGITRKGVDLTQSPVRVGDQSSIDDVVIALATDLASVAGRIAAPEGIPKLDLSDAVVIMAPANDATRRARPGLMSATADARGDFVIRCAPGEYFVTAVTSGELKKLAIPIGENYFKDDNQKFQRVKVKAGEKIKGLNVLLAAN